jgi:hypothetical protein
VDFDIDVVEKFVSPKDLVSIGVIWMIVKNQAAHHFKTIEDNLKMIGNSIVELKDSIVDLEIKQTEKINELSDRVTNIETTLKGE